MGIFDFLKKSKRAQGSLEYIILIGGVIIIGAAAYFMLRGFMSTAKTETNETISKASNLTQGELDNISQWASP
jgi:uncharacterized protein (UPF0333 family)